MIGHLKRLDWILITSSLLLAGIGLLSIFSSSMGRGDFSNFSKQLVFIGVGLGIMLLLSFIDYRLIRNDPYLILFLYGTGVIALLGLLLFAPEIRGVRGWYRIGEITIDPIEYIKIVLVILLARYFASRHVEVYRLRNIIFSAIYFIPPILLIFLQPDLGASVLLLILWVVMLLVAGMKLKHFFALVVAGLLVFSLGWTLVLQDYQKDRLMSFVEPELDPLGTGWSQMQSRIAIGSGGLLGQGIGGGTQTQYGFLSEPQTDFIFAAIAEEFGLVGIILIFFLLLLIVWRIIKIGLESETNFARLFAAGFATLFIVEATINIGMNLGFLPIIGLPLPFVSYGGSIIIMTSIGFGILQSIKAHS
ncbi:MAG TPA: rod shape-determining protein RodA [candidate division CPR3 bacterium]|uniref:Rod shape-determining protein RodA n=1 Tax=candidate division CPR3 bacterium TaxID=2268181 RepID=A0A7C1T5L9_UNCC3|nr:rod shape-determining protein RodA [candidate division CPR3 bacterium]